MCDQSIGNETGHCLTAAKWREMFGDWSIAMATVIAHARAGQSVAQIPAHVVRDWLPRGRSGRPGVEEFTMLLAAGQHLLYPDDFLGHHARSLEAHVTAPPT